MPEPELICHPSVTWSGTTYVRLFARDSKICRLLRGGQCARTTWWRRASKDKMLLWRVETY